MPPVSASEETATLMRSTKGREREVEIALVERLSSRLDEVHGAPSSELVSMPKPARKPRKSLSEQTKSATSNILAAKALVRGIVKACVLENIATSIKENKNISVVDFLVEEYRHKYPTLTKQMVIDGVSRHKNSEEGAEKEGRQDTEGDVDDDPKLTRRR